MIYRSVAIASGWFARIRLAVMMSCVALFTTACSTEVTFDCNVPATVYYRTAPSNGADYVRWNDTPEMHPKVKLASNCRHDILIKAEDCEDFAMRLSQDPEPRYPVHLPHIESATKLQSNVPCIVLYRPSDPPQADWSLATAANTTPLTEVLLSLKDKQPREIRATAFGYSDVVTSTVPYPPQAHYTISFDHPRPLIAFSTNVPAKFFYRPCKEDGLPAPDPAWISCNADAAATIRLPIGGKAYEIKATAKGYKDIVQTIPADPNPPQTEYEWQFTQ